MKTTKNNREAKENFIPNITYSFTSDRFIKKPEIISNIAMRILFLKYAKTALTDDEKYNQCRNKLTEDIPNEIFPNNTMAGKIKTSLRRAIDSAIENTDYASWIFLAMSVHIIILNEELRYAQCKEFIDGEFNKIKKILTTDNKLNYNLEKQSVYEIVLTSYKEDEKLHIYSAAEFIKKKLAIYPEYKYLANANYIDLTDSRIGEKIILPILIAFAAVKFLSSASMFTGFIEPSQDINLQPSYFRLYLFQTALLIGLGIMLYVKYLKYKSGQNNINTEEQLKRIIEVIDINFKLTIEQKAPRERKSANTNKRREMAMVQLINPTTTSDHKVHETDTISSNQSETSISTHLDTKSEQSPDILKRVKKEKTRKSKAEVEMEAKSQESKPQTNRTEQLFSNWLGDNKSRDDYSSPVRLQWQSGYDSPYIAVIYQPEQNDSMKTCLETHNTIQFNSGAGTGNYGPILLSKIFGIFKIKPKGAAKRLAGIAQDIPERSENKIVIFGSPETDSLTKAFSH